MNKLVDIITMATGIGAVVAALLILFRIIPHMSRNYKWHANFLWLFVMGMGLLGLTTFFNKIGSPVTPYVRLAAESMLVLGALLLCISKEFMSRKLPRAKGG